jgi:hypothetical protein
VIVVLSSCAGFPKNSYPHKKIINNENLHIVNGKYDSDLWQYIAPLSSKVKDTINYSVLLNVINHKKIKASLMKNDAIIDSKKIRGKIDSNKFSVRRKIIPIIIFPLFLQYYYENKINISMTEQDDLCLEISEYQLVSILFMAGRKEEFYRIFERK